MSDEDISKLVEALQVQDSSILSLLSKNTNDKDNNNNKKLNNNNNNNKDVNALTFEIEKLQSLVISYQDKYIKLKRNADRLKRQLEQKELEDLLANDNNADVSKMNTIIKSPSHTHSASLGSSNFNNNNKKKKKNKNNNNDNNNDKKNKVTTHVKLKRRQHPQRNQLEQPKNNEKNHRKIVSGHSWWAPPVAVKEDDNDKNSGPVDMSTTVVHLDRRGSVLENFIVDKVQDDEIVQQVKEEERRLNRKVEEINRYDKDLENYKRFLGLLRSHKSERELTLKQIRNGSL